MNIPRREHSPPVKSGEEGYVLLGVMLLLAVFLIMMSLVVPKIREDIRRDQELETIRRGQQYIRALQLYYRRFHRFPSSLDELVDTNGLRFLRRRYADPLTHSDDWKPVYLGRNQAPLTMGYFGTVLNPGSAIANNPGGAGTGSSILGTPPPSAFNAFSNPGTGNSGAGSDPAPGPWATGGAIIGLSPSLAQPSILVYKTKAQYDEWEFVYDPLTDRTLPRWTSPVGGPYAGAPGVSPN